MLLEYVEVTKTTREEKLSKEEIKELDEKDKVVYVTGMDTINEKLNVTDDVYIGWTKLGQEILMGNKRGGAVNLHHTTIDETGFGYNFQGEQAKQWIAVGIVHEGIGHPVLGVTRSGERDHTDNRLSKDPTRTLELNIMLSGPKLNEAGGDYPFMAKNGVLFFTKPDFSNIFKYYYSRTVK